VVPANYAESQLDYETRGKSYGRKRGDLLERGRCLMGRKVQKVEGALVRMGRRRKPGFGIILHKTDRAPHLMTHEEQEMTPVKPIARDYQAATATEVCALVHWFEKPSEWENNETHSNRTWVPLSWLRVISKGK